MVHIGKDCMPQFHVMFCSHIVGIQWSLCHQLVTVLCCVATLPVFTFILIFKALLFGFSQLSRPAMGLLLPQTLQNFSHSLSSKSTCMIPQIHFLFQSFTPSITCFLSSKSFNITCQYELMSSPNCDKVKYIIRSEFSSFKQNLNSPLV